MIKKKIHILILFLALTSCVKDKTFDIPKITCSNELQANTTFADVKNLYIDELIQIHKDLIIEGYVVSSDKAGNFFGTLHIQDNPRNPTQGFQIEIDVRDSYLFYQVGRKIYVKLKGLYLGQSKEIYKVGGVFTAFGNESVGRLPSAIVSQHIFLSCDVPMDIKPIQASLETLQESMVNTLVQINELEVVEEELGLTFAEPKEETERTLKDCNGNEIALINSGYSDFQEEILPNGNGSVVGVLIKENDDFKLIIKEVEDLRFGNERCPPDMVTSNQIFISELADPNNNAGARFVELYNASNKEISLKGWILRRYTNANTEVSSTIDLSGFSIEPKTTFVISPNATEFETVYGFVPDLGVSTNSPADSNGDDNLELIDPFEVVIDVFGIVGEDGSGTNHEFEDGRAVRNSTVIEANLNYTFFEWSIFNDTGNSGTTNLPQNAPDDFTPGVRD